MTFRTNNPHPAGTTPEELRLHSVGDLVRRCTDDVRLLVQTEVRSAKAEIAATVGRWLGGGIMVVSAAVLALCGLGALTTAAIVALALAWPLWLSALVIGGALIVVAAGCVALGIAAIKHAQPPVPRQTLGQVKEDLEWVRQHARPKATRESTKS